MCLSSTSAPWMAAYEDFLEILVKNEIGLSIIKADSYRNIILTWKLVQNADQQSLCRKYTVLRYLNRRKKPDIHSYMQKLMN